MKHMASATRKIQDIRYSRECVDIVRSSTRLRRNDRSRASCDGGGCVRDVRGNIHDRRTMPSHFPHNWRTPRRPLHAYPSRVTRRVDMTKRTLDRHRASLGQAVIPLSLLALVTLVGGLVYHTRTLEASHRATAEN